MNNTMGRSSNGIVVRIAAELLLGRGQIMTLLALLATVLREVPEARGYSSMHARDVSCNDAPTVCQVEWGLVGDGPRRC